MPIAVRICTPISKSSSWYARDIDVFSTRPKDPYRISPEDKATILETLPYWQGKSMEDISDAAMPEYIQQLEADDILCVGLENGVSGETTCDHEKCCVWVCADILRMPAQH